MIPIGDIRRRLQHCAPTATIELKKHRYWVKYNELTFRGLPKGSHGDRRVQIESGHVVQLVKHLQIDQACAQLQLPILNLKSQTV